MQPEQQCPESGRSDMRSEEGPSCPGRAHDQNHESCDQTDRQARKAHALQSEPSALEPPFLLRRAPESDRQGQAEQRMKNHVGEVPQRCCGEGDE